MPSVAVLNTSGSEVGRLELSDAVFAAPQNALVVRETFNAYRSNQRQGTHSTKTRGFVSGGGKKPWKQKGTGRARAGSSRSPIWRGGAIIFGPQPRDYREKINRKKRQAAFRAVLSARAEEGALKIVDQIDLSAAPKTRALIGIIESLGATNGRVLFVTATSNDLLIRCARNIPYADVAVVNALNIFDLLVSDCLVVTREAAEKLQEHLS
ncbi:50S ribosomal protein L4 [Candidatus Poribacteria bacterium]|nr:50S ribosomal protein L4 [Candidatus Poribacteria bacterium]